MVGLSDVTDCLYQGEIRLIGLVPLYFWISATVCFVLTFPVDYCVNLIQPLKVKTVVDKKVLLIIWLEYQVLQSCWTNAQLGSLGC